MNLIIDFYKELDTINLIIFWGIILVILLLLVFAIIITNKNKKLRRIIYTKEQEIEETKNELAIKQDIIDEKNKTIINKSKTKINDITINSPVIEEKESDQQKKDITVNVVVDNTKERQFNKEEIIIKQEPQEIVQTQKEDINIQPTKEEFIVEEYIKPENKDMTPPTGPYQKNVLREMSLNQTSPIGITKKEPNPQKDILNANITKTTIKNVEIIEDPVTIETYKNNYKEEMDNSKRMINELYKEEIKTNLDKTNNYLEELSKKIEESNPSNDIKRTDYELKQEEEAIISYNELMQKKDSIKIDDEENAVISIKELKDKERIYNITKEEENDEFISELKQFRSDL